MMLNRRSRPCNKTFKRTENTLQLAARSVPHGPVFPQRAPREPRHLKYGLCIESSFLDG